MKKLLVTLMIIVTLFTAIIGTAAAENVYGNTEKRTTFTVNARYDGAYIVLSSSTGKALVAQHNWIGKYTGDGYEIHHGFYRVTRRGNGCPTESFIWAPSATTKTSGIMTCEEVKLSFARSGQYTLTIEPLSNSEAARYWRVDSIKSWLYDASWNVTITSGCGVSF